LKKKNFKGQKKVIYPVNIPIKFIFVLKIQFKLLIKANYSIYYNIDQFLKIWGGDQLFLNDIYFLKNVILENGQHKNRSNIYYVRKTALKKIYPYGPVISLPRAVYCRPLP